MKLYKKRTIFRTSQSFHVSTESTIEIWYQNFYLIIAILRLYLCCCTHQFRFRILSYRHTNAVRAENQNKGTNTRAWQMSWDWKKTCVHDKFDVRANREIRWKKFLFPNQIKNWRILRWKKIIRSEFWSSRWASGLFLSKQRQKYIFLEKYCFKALFYKSTHKLIDSFDIFTLAIEEKKPNIIITSCWFLSLRILNLPINLKTLIESYSY